MSSDSESLSGKTSHLCNFLAEVLGTFWSVVVPFYPDIVYGNGKALHSLLLTHE